MKNPLLLFLLFFINIINVSAQEKRDFSFNMVKAIDKITDANAPQYGFITGTDKENEKFYFVMVYPENATPKRSINIEYITEGIRKDNVRSVRAVLIPYNGIVIIGKYRLVVYEAAGRTSIRRMYVLDPGLSNRADHKIFINRKTGNALAFEPDQFDALIEMNLKHFEPTKDEVAGFRMLQKIPDIIASGYPVTDASGNYLNGIIASPNSDEAFDVIVMSTIRKKLSIMSDDGDNCKYFNLINDGHKFTECEEPYKEDSIAKAKVINEKNAQTAKAHDVDYPIAISLQAGPTAQYINVAGTVVPGFGYFGGLNLHILPDKGGIGFSIRPQYSAYHYNPSYSSPYVDQNAVGYNVNSANRNQFGVQVMAEIRFNRRLPGDNYIGVGYSRAFTPQENFNVVGSDGSSVRYTLPNNKNSLNGFCFDIGWDLSKVRYVIGTTYMPIGPFPRDYTININNNVLTPFTNINSNNFILHFSIAYRLWGHWRNGIKG